MALHVNRVTVDALDPAAQARFRVEALGWHLVGSGDDEQAKRSTNRWHLDLAPDDQAVEVARLEGLGARRADIGQGDAAWTVMTDPEGNEFCVLTDLPA